MEIYGDVELVSAPLIPEDGEKVIAVEAMTLQEARQNFMNTGRPDLAELYEIDPIPHSLQRMQAMLL
jgi:hypothetical protein